ncbi:MAG: acyl carrier protein [Pirellulales bacterium]|nr:acyl carrier protein [Pirellulales bacterium]
MKTSNEVSTHYQIYRETVLADITKIVAEHMEQPEDEIGENAHLINDIGCDSLDITEIIMLIEDHFDIDIPEDNVEDARTPGQVADGLFKLLGNIEND